MQLMFELCDVFEFGAASQTYDTSLEPLAPYTAGFLSALALPFYDVGALQPQLPAPSHHDSTLFGLSDADRQSIMQYYEDLPYYMTLTLDPISLGSMAWSIFWQPNIYCNLVSPWLNAIQHTIRPFLQSKDFECLAKVFACRRPRVAIIWLGIFLLGSPAITDRIERYLSVLEEREYNSSWAVPDSVIASWTGSPQSFWDTPYQQCEKTDTVSRADVLQARRSLRFPDDQIGLFSWRPFGHVSRKELEPDLLDNLKTPKLPVYDSWTWLGSPCQQLQLGYRRDKNRFIEDVPDDLELIQPIEFHKPSVILAMPSKKATLLMIHYSMYDLFWDKSLEIAAVPELTIDHMWLKDWRGLE
ncbi:hypothetical protein JX266_014143 [Neoarthrinium moseri]|nr:hypothetical protein JX266_014143 [Neoarthrinium moseri]